MLHKHHIVPRHAGGTNDSGNIKLLTIEAHAEAHRILWEQYGRWQDELAYKGLAGIIGHEEVVKELCGKVNRGRKHSEQWKVNNSVKHKGMKRPPRTEEWKRKQRESQIGKQRPVEVRQKISNTMKGRVQYKWTDEQRLAHSLKQTGKKRGPYKPRRKQAKA